MNIRHFVSGCSVVLASWLLMTYFEEVPADRYPALGRGSVPLQATAEAPQPDFQPSAGTKVEVALSTLDAALEAKAH
jgi:hypothetical protein